MKKPPSPSPDPAGSPHIPYEALARLLQNAIDGDGREAIAQHLAECAFCRQDLADAEQWSGHLSSLPEQAAKAARIGFVWNRLLVAGLVLAGMLVLIGFVWYSLR